jgi:hypothetical protein
MARRNAPYYSILTDVLEPFGYEFKKADKLAGKPQYTFEMKNPASKIY